MTHLSLNNITKVIKSKTVLSGINLELHEGTVVGFKGINGSGKTMLMRIITGLIKPTSGTVYVNGKKLHKDISFPPSIGVLLENPAFLEDYSGKENLKILAGIKGIISESDVDCALERVGLTDAANKKYKKYSLGMKQRLGIAAAIMEKPDIVVLDEPTNSLDTDGIEMVKQIVRNEKDRGALVIISCHENEILKVLSDVICNIENGQITSIEYREESE